MDIFKAAGTGNLTNLKECLSKGIEINSRDDAGHTALFTAAWKNNINIVEYLLKSEADAEVRENSAQWTALIVATDHNHREVVELLVTNQAQVNVQDADGCTALYWAAWRGHQAVARVVLQYKADPEIRQYQDQWTALRAAARHNHSDVVQVLLAHGARINTQDKLGQTPLWSVAFNGHKDMVTVLLQHKACVNMCCNTGASPLYAAGQNGHTEVAAMLLDAGANIESRTNTGSTPLIIATWHKKPAMVKFLCQRMALINANDTGGSTALHVAAEENALDTITILMKYRPEIKKNKAGKTALDLAKDKNYSDIVSVIEDYMTTQGAAGNTDVRADLSKDMHVINDKTVNPNKDAAPGIPDQEDLLGGWEQAPLGLQQNMEQIQVQLDHLVIEKRAGNEEVYNWVDSNLAKSNTKTSGFIRALMTSLCSSALTVHTGGCRVDTQIVKQRRHLLELYLCNHNPHLELQALYAVQALLHKLHHPRDILRLFFDTLYDAKIISDNAFHQWYESTDPAEQAGRETARHSVKQFFRRLREAQEMENQDEGHLHRLLPPADLHTPEGAVRGIPPDPQPPVHHPVSQKKDHPHTPLPSADLHTAKGAVEDNSPDAETVDQPPPLCEKCLLCVADVTLEEQEFIDVFSKVSKDICNKFSNNVISSDVVGQIFKALSDSHANFMFRQALKNSVDGKKIDTLLRVLSQNSYELHACKIQAIYREVLKQHREKSKCDKCSKEK